MAASQKVVLLAFAVLFLAGMSLVLRPYSVAGDLSTQISPTPTARLTDTPRPPPGPSRTPTATPVDADYMPVILREYGTPTPGPSPTFTIPMTSTPKPPPGG